MMTFTAKTTNVILSCVISQMCKINKNYEASDVMRKFRKCNFYFRNIRNAVKIKFPCLDRASAVGFFFPFHSMVKVSIRQTAIVCSCNFFRSYSFTDLYFQYIEDKNIQAVDV